MSDFLPNEGDQFSPDQPNTDQPNGDSTAHSPMGEQPYVFDHNKYGASFSGGMPPVSPKPPKNKKKGGIVLAIILCSVIGVSAIAIGVTSLVKNNITTGDSEGSGIVLQDRPEDDTVTNTTDKMSTEQVAEKVKSSVVGILSYGSYNTVDPSSSGSGIIISKDGYIVTNAHVVDGAVGISVLLEDGTEKTAKLIGQDTKTDLAVIKIEGENYAFAEFGNSDQLKVGETVVAIGNPGGMTLYGSITQGIVSGLNRVLNSSDVYSLHCIQTDAAINPGNSGGALVNLYGQVIGINSSKIAATEFEGIGFAISINDAKPIIETLIANGYVKDRVKLGVAVTEITETLAGMNNVPQGLYIRQINEGGSMDGSGAQVGDIITHINGQRINDFTQLQTQLAAMKPGQKVSVTLYRRLSSTTNTTLDVNITMQEDTGQATKQSK